VDQNDHLQDSYAPGPTPRPGVGGKIKKALGPVGVVIVALFVKFKFALLAVLKFLPILLKTGGTMILSVWVYAMFFGLWFAVGFVLLIFVHECGHLLAAKRFGLKVSAPMFIPFFGAVILLRESPRNAWVESVVGIGGPLLGSAGALACVGLYQVTSNAMFLALAYTGFWINLFNLMPVGFLDGGRVVTALSPWMWLVGFILLILFTINQFFFSSHISRFNFVLILIIITSLPRLFSLFRPRTEAERRYFEVTPEQRLLMGALYFGLIAALALGMKLAFIPREALQ